MSLNRDSHKRSVIKPSRLPLFQKTMPQRHTMVCPGKKQIRRMIHRDHANDLTTYKVLVGGAVFLLIMVAVALSQASCDHRALMSFPWTKKDAFAQAKENVGLGHGDATGEIRELREEVSACRTQMLSAKNVAKQLKQQLDETKEKLTATSEELIAKKNAHDSAEVHRAALSLELGSTSKALAAEKEQSSVYKMLRDNARSALAGKTEELGVTVAALEKEQEKNANLTSELKAANDTITAKNKTLLGTGAIINRLSKRITECNTAVNETTGNLTSLTDASQRGTGNLKAAVWITAAAIAKVTDANTKLAEAQSKLATTTTSITSLNGGIQRGKANVAAAATKLDLATSKKDLEELRKLMMPLPQSLKAPLTSSNGNVRHRGANITTSSSPAA